EMADDTFEIAQCAEKAMQQKQVFFSTLRFNIFKPSFFFNAVFHLRDCQFVKSPGYAGRSQSAKIVFLSLYSNSARDTDGRLKGGKPGKAALGWFLRYIPLEAGLFFLQAREFLLPKLKKLGKVAIFTASEANFMFQKPSPVKTFSRPSLPLG
ncbi:MAG TPA: hypothetical protein PLU64_04775, partial [Saprospiraceae bacterium]|nr:hypothetical protein [Saprospiraceae bacterium]